MDLLMLETAQVVKIAVLRDSAANSPGGEDAVLRDSAARADVCYLGVA
jgi:hypothetical protein